MSRLSPLAPDALTDDQKAVLDAINRGPRARAGQVGLEGPFGVWVRSPSIGMAVQSLGAAVRYGTALPDGVREVAICTVGAHYQAKFEFAAHAAFARNAGVEDSVLDAIRLGRTPALGDEQQQVAHDVARELVRDHGLSDASFRRARAVFGESVLIELVSVVGYYCLVSLTLNAFQVSVPEGMEDPFADRP